MSVKRLGILFSSAALSLLTHIGAAGAVDYVTIATGGVSGAYYTIGSAIALAVSKSGAIQATAETGNASVANLHLIGKGESEVGFAQNDTAFWAYNGLNMFRTPKKNLRAVSALYLEHLQVVIAKDAKIDNIHDLQGKRVSVGAPGSGAEADARAIFEVAQLRYSDMQIHHFDFGATTKRFKDNAIDVGFVVAGFPTASIMDLTTAKDVGLLSFNQDFLAQLNKEHPYFVPGIIPANTYLGIDQDTQTPALVAMLVTHDKASEKVIYEFVKHMYANLDTVHASHPAARQITLEKALHGVTLPLHPGAAKFFTEKGLKIPDIK